MILDFFKYPEQADDQVDAIHRQAHADEADERELVIAYSIADGSFEIW